MAQKQFKIGLSNTDKQNMAQDVYERLLALTFNEYDTTTEYEVGDFVVYNDQLYKCIGATSGAWDSTKWQLATLNDLVDDIENAVAFVNDKANVDGNYPTMTVGMADNLTPYDESAGDDQDEPFSFQATGTGNGTQSDFATGSIALMKEKQGNSVVVNQLSKELNATNWSGTDATVSFADGIATFTATKQYGTIKSSGFYFNMIENHKYLAIIEHKGTAGSFAVYFSSGQYIPDFLNNRTDAGFAFVSKIFTYAKTSGNTRLNFQDNRASDWTEQQIKNLAIIDLTQWFNGDIPQDLLDNPSNFFRYYQGSLAYNEGTLVNADGRYIKCIGMNQWDEEWELGSYSTSNGNKDDWQASGGSIRSKNKVKVIPNTTYYCKVAASTGNYILFYDIDNNYLGYVFIHSTGETFTTPANAYYITYRKDGVSTYGNDTSINLYYEDEERCLTYEPYQVLTNTDTGTETLRSAGSVKDYKTPDGTVHRRVGVADFGDLIWAYNETDGQPTFVTTLSDAVSFAYNKDYSNLACSKYIQTAWYNNRTQNGYDKTIAQGGRIISVRDSAYNDAAAFKTAMTGVYLFYELAEPTTEQGTPYSENLVIDDFGSMDFGSDVPQGALIFYPVDYKAFVDTLYDYTEGTPSNIALKSDLSASETQRDTVDSQLLNAIGGTLRHCLAIQESDLNFEDTDVVDLSSLTFVRELFTDRYIFQASIPSDMKANAKFLSTKYPLGTKSASSLENQKMYIGASNINIRDDSYSSADTFKNAMKGVLLAYEKASE